MSYCKKYMLLILDRNKKCPLCNNKKLVEVKANDPVYLITKEMIWDTLICDILNENDIPYLKHGNLGIALEVVMGTGTQYYKYYVPYKEYGIALQLMQDIFTNETEDEDEDYNEDEFDLYDIEEIDDFEE